MSPSALFTPRACQLREELAHDSLPGLIFVHIGEAREESPTPKDGNRCMSFGFVSGGCGSRHGYDMKRIPAGAIAFAHASGTGYVAWGQPRANGEKDPAQPTVLP